ncbi:centromere protein O isoform X2 [Puntigrus tetrazona]|uniref:centromere protein O isoform X2 n=1 Tax=Puntigrus tetrazona TaxID=1606681 RepID=UPI001C890C76|nr:centromere protein O isoform X2 [Puntigrus tetrazona]
MDSFMETMEQGVLGHLMALERGGMGRQKQHDSQRSETLKARAVTLRAKRDQLKHHTDVVKTLKDKIVKGLPLRDEDAAADGFVELQKSLLTAWRMQLKDLQRAHHLIGNFAPVKSHRAHCHCRSIVPSLSGGYDLVECKDGKSACVSFHTAFEGVRLETYSVELDLTRAVQISRHNVPPSFPLESLAKRTLQKDLKAFLQTLSQNLNALAARRRQVCLLKELVGSVEVMESNQLCSVLVLMCTAQSEAPKAVLCTLEYGDLAQCLPTRVSIECEDKVLSGSPQWKKNQSLLLESPAHTALLTMRRMGSIS